MADYHAARRWLERLVAFDTTSRYSNLPLIACVADFLSAQGAFVEHVYNEEGNKANLLARIGPEAPGGVLLSGHTDVVPVDGQDWDTDPFQLSEREGLLYGRGTSDMKGFLACMLAMVPAVIQADLTEPVYLAFSYDEEVGCLGAGPLARFMQKQSLAPKLAIIGEPTEMRIVTRHKGIHSYETVVTGHEAHSSAPGNGVNAVLIASRLVLFLEQLAVELRDTPAHSHFDPPYTTVHVGVMQGGTARNIIPGQCTLLWEIRPLPGQDVAELKGRFDRYCRDIEMEMQARFPATGIGTRSLSNVIGLEKAAALPEAALLHLAESNRTETAAFTTEAGIFQHHGIPSIVCGPGSIAQAHKPNEFIAVSQLEACLAFFHRLLSQAQSRAGIFA